jgi:membrane fusion protein (multidrug efflux system)
MVCKNAVRAAIVLAATALSLIVPIGCSKSESQPQMRGRGGPLPVEGMVIQPQVFENNIFTTGTLLASEEVELRPEISGRVVGVLFQEGKHVSQGDILVKINDEELQAQLKRKQLEEKLAADDEHRKKALLNINGISQEDYDKALNALDMIKAERQVIESQIAKTQIVAPFDGVVGLRYVSEGSFITPSTRVATIQDLDSLKVEFSVPEKHARQIHEGTRVMVQVGDSQEWREGVVFAVEAKVDPATRTIKARAVLPYSDGHLIPGSFSKVKITLQRFPDAIMIPSGAVVPQLNGEYAYVCRNGAAYSVPVTIGVRTDRDVQITDGLNAGDTLITTGLLQLTEGKAVTTTLVTNNQT